MLPVVLALWQKASNIWSGWSGARLGRRKGERGGMPKFPRQLSAARKIGVLYRWDSARPPPTAMIEASRRWLNSVLISIGLPSLASTVISCSHTGAGAGVALGVI